MSWNELVSVINMVAGLTSQCGQFAKSKHINALSMQSKNKKISVSVKFLAVDFLNYIYY